MDVFARNAVDSSAQLRDPAATPGLSNSSALAAALPGGHSRKETRNMVEWIYETDHYRKAYEGKKMKKVIGFFLTAVMLISLLSSPIAASEAPASEAQTSEAQTSKEQASEAQTSDAQTPKEQASEAQTSDAQTSAEQASEAQTSAEQASEAQEPDYSTGTPWPDIDLEGVVTPEMSAELKDDYALAVNKEDILNLKIPEGYPTAGTIMDLDLLQQEDVKKMFLGEAPDSHDAKLAYDLFWLMMDWDSRNALGVSPLKEMTEAVEEISSIDELTSYYIETPLEKQLTCLWDCGSIQDFADSNRYILYVDNAGFLLDDSAEYRSLTPYGAVKKDAYTLLATKILRKLGYSEAEAAKKIDNCFALESMIAETAYTSEEQNKPDFLDQCYNIFSREDLEARQGRLPILNYLEHVKGYPAAEEYMVIQPELLDKLNDLYTEDNLPLIRDMMIVTGIVSNAGSLDRECYAWSRECTNTSRGSTGTLDDETVFSASVANILIWPVAQLYTQAYLNQGDKDRISALVDEILDAYHDILKDADFLSDETRAKAIEKLEAIDKRILFPDSWEKYSYDNLDFASREEGGTFWDARTALTKYALAKNVKEYSLPFDKEKWSAPPHEVNCFYNPQTNSIYIMGAFARGDFYNSEMSDEELYGTLGSVIGHEISHAFDSTGAQFDKNGDKNNWWTKEDYDRFLEKNQKMVDYYNAMHPWEGQNYYGSIMTGEACADMAGIKVMLLLAAQKPDFDYDLFFRTFAHDYLTKDTLQMTYLRINDVHPICCLRINATLQQYDEFLNFYGITEGDGMYLAPDDRVNIW